MEVARGVYKFDTGPFNWYVVEGAGRLTVVDAGFPGHYAALEAGLKALGRSVADVAAVLLTHAHADHTGFAERLRRTAGCPVYVHRDDLEKAGRRLQLPWPALVGNAWRGYTRGMLLHATWNGVFALSRVTDARPVADGQTLDVPGRPVAVHVPGHTPGETAFFLPARGVLLSGDALVTTSLRSGGESAPRLVDRPLNMDTDQARRSLAKLAGLGGVTLLPGHGRPWAGDMREAVDRAAAG